MVVPVAVNVVILIEVDLLIAGIAFLSSTHSASPAIIPAESIDKVARSPSGALTAVDAWVNYLWLLKADSDDLEVIIEIELVGH